MVSFQIDRDIANEKVLMYSASSVDSQAAMGIFS